MGTEEIDIAKHLVILEETGSPVHNIIQVSLGLAQESRMFLEQRRN